MSLEKQYNYSVDAKGLRCPMPLLKAKLALNDLQENQTLQLLATDPVSVRDITAYCEQMGYEINLVVLENKIFQYLITKT